MGNAAGGAGLVLLMAGRPDEASEWLHRAAERYRESIAGAPAGSWGRPIGAIKALVLAGDWEAAEEAARWALELGAGEAESPIGSYAAALALLVLGRDHEASATRTRSAPHRSSRTTSATHWRTSPRDDVIGYTYAIEDVLESFENRDEYLEDIPVADTVLVLQALATRRGFAVELSSPLLPREVRWVHERGDHDRIDGRVLEIARLLDELGDQLERLLGVTRAVTCALRN